ncbi:helix-turn-helix domain-containing protein [Metasolibacillus meyeri]|uniref:Helix-turn-helix domain-containing protein n=1 Tax=Metasolibacillus meyeri TaxID=1071052 RepID=A0AAW9NHT4_9BACL|nr:helix-turn-helix domain-containing protein [Metasolibacillus meyeri]MEC1178234.1 helix-turn-helix domain-containing protein [Metasolibacillus meyeri]
MISMNLKQLRKKHQYTQEEVAEKINVSRQAVAKWEKGESIPDMASCMALAKLYDVTLDDLVNHQDEVGLGIAPKGKHLFGVAIVGERGQIVIPKKARDLFKIEVGDSLIILGDEDRGLAIVPESYTQKFFKEALRINEEDKE